MTEPKNKNKNYCSKCHSKHYPPTGKKCQVMMDNITNDPSTSVHPVNSSGDSDSDVRDSRVGAVNVDMGVKKKITRQKDCSVRRVSTSGQSRPSDQADDSETSEDEHPSGGLQTLILKELQRVNHRLDDMEAKVQGHRHHRKHEKDCQKLSTSKYMSKNEGCSKKSTKRKHFSDSSSDEELLPPLSVLRTSCEIQKQVDARISEIESHSKVEGNDNTKLKSKRGGGRGRCFGVKKVAWPHDNVLGGGGGVEAEGHI